MRFGVVLFSWPANKHRAEKTTSVECAAAPTSMSSNHCALACLSLPTAIVAGEPRKSQLAQELSIAAAQDMPPRLANDDKRQRVHRFSEADSAHVLLGTF